MTTLEAHIHGRTFRLGAPEAERDALAEAIAIVEAECLVIAQKQPTAEIERVLLLAALELAAAKRDDARAIRKYRYEGATPADIRRMVGL